MAEEILANLLAGLGLFFIGVKFIGENMRQMAGRGFRRLVARFTRVPAVSVLSGLIAGALVQSATAVTFIMTSLISSRLITVRTAMPIITWSNVGSSLIVLLAVLDLRLAALFLLGTIGVCFYFNLDKSSRFRHAVGALLGLGMLLLGLMLMKAGAGPLKEIEWLRHFLTYTKSSYLLAFLTGGIFTFIAQSSTTVSVIAIAMARVGLLGMDQTIMIIYGSNLGSGMSTWFMASNLKGTPRQLAVFQAMFKFVGALVLVPLFYVELHLRVPGMQHLVSRLSADLGHQMADVYFLFQLTAAAIVSLAMTPIHRLLERLSPATPEEELTRTQFIYEQALEEPETALDLVEKEQLRLVQHLPEFLDTVREETAANATVGPATLRKAVTGVGAEVTAFVTELMDRHQSRTSLERALNLQNRTEVIVSIAETLDDLVSNAPRAGQPEKLSLFTHRLAEALHVILTTAYDAAEQPSDENRRMLLRLTADRGEMMEQVRRSFLGERTLNPASQQNLMTITTHFERTIWLLRRFGMLLGASGGGK
ncbi:MAG: Na/Pi cotransporter family protein [Limisphaerales bacterium]